MYSIDTNPFIWLILTVLEIYFWVVMASVVMSWLVAFGVVNLYNPFIGGVCRVLNALTDPVLRRVRRIIPPIAGLDLSPMVVLLGVLFLQKTVVWFYFHVLIRWLP